MKSRFHNVEFVKNSDFKKKAKEFAYDGINIGGAGPMLKP